MGQILRNWRVPGAVFIAFTVIGGSYLLARSVEVPSTAQASAETALLQKIATKDSSGDGLPDWQKALYGIPVNATTTDYFNLGMTDGEAVAKGLIVPKAIANDPTTATSTDQGTLTESFSKAFFSLYLSAKQANNGASLTPDQTNALANEAFNNFVQNFAPSANFKKADDLKPGGTGPDALAAFASAAERVFSRYQSITPINEFQTVRDSLQNGDPTAISAVAAAATIYRDYALGFAALPVPNELAVADLALINAFEQRASIYDGIAAVNTDPLLTIVSIQQLPQNEMAWQQALAAMGNTYAAENIGLSQGTPGAGFIRFAVKLHALYP